MNYFLIFCGLILVVFTGPSVLREWLHQQQKKSPEELPTRQEIHPGILEYLQSMEDRIGAMTDALVEMAEAVDKAVFAKPLPQQDFTEAFHQSQKANTAMSINDKIYQAFENGKSITEIAQEFGRGKGEIELILNLKR